MNTASIGTWKNKNKKYLSPRKSKNPKKKIKIITIHVKADLKLMSEKNKKIFN
jgi:hypothetical protein